jgi:ribonuclease-3
MSLELAECQRVIGYHFANSKLLEVALTHSSLRSPDRECNERLEFLGDSVLGLVVTEELYRLLPDQAEGELTRLKSAIVSRGALYLASQRLGLARFADFARGVSRREELPVSVTANLVEAVIGAIYLDAGFFPAREFVLRHLGEELELTLSDRGAKNYKSLLQHAVQDAMGFTPTYRTVEEGGPDHRKQFVVAAMIRGQEWGRAEGGTKKEAEQEAAQRALEAFQRRGRGRRRRRGGHDDEGLVGAREVGEHVDEAGPYDGSPSAAEGLAPESTARARLRREPVSARPWPGPRAGALPSRRRSRGPAPAVLSPADPDRRRAGGAGPARAAPALPRPPLPERRAPTGRRPCLRRARPRLRRRHRRTRGCAAAVRTPEHAVGSVAARKKAPAAWTPPPTDDGFGTGL